MKLLKYITIIACAVLVQACSLERQPLTDLSEDNFWTSDNKAKLALTAVYRGNITGGDDGVEYSPSDFWSYHGMLFMENLTDNGFDRRGENNQYYQITSGKMTNTNSFVRNYWRYAYKRIQLCNQFLEGVQNMSDGPDKARYTAEAKFLRAATYQYLASYFHDVPLVTRVLTGEESNNVKKTSQAEVLAWCAQELRNAADSLPRFSALTSSETGRACKQAALAFLGRVYMLQENWKAGADTYKEIIDLGDNEINPSYSELFLPGTGTSNKENIFYIAYLENYFGSGLPQQQLSAKDGGWSLPNPSAGLFEAYEFKDGTPFSYDDPRYNPNNLGENRDPRLDYTIYYNGATFQGTTYRMSPDYDASAKERVDYSSEASKTGFMWRKYIGESPIANIASYSAVNPVIRYAEVLLSYLECLNESGQTITQGILDETINKVRGRADVQMPPITTTDQTKLREIIRHERRVELAYEGIRLWDLMRWHIAHIVLNGDVWGAPYPNSTKYATSTKKVDPTGHCRWYAGTRAFRNPQDYTWPIPLSEQNINPNLRESNQ